MNCKGYLCEIAEIVNKVQYLIPIEKSKRNPKSKNKYHAHTAWRPWHPHMDIFHDFHEINKSDGQ